MDGSGRRATIFSEHKFNFVYNLQGSLLLLSALLRSLFLFLLVDDLAGHAKLVVLLVVGCEPEHTDLHVRLLLFKFVQQRILQVLDSVGLEEFQILQLLKDELKRVLCQLVQTIHFNVLDVRGRLAQRRNAKVPNTCVAHFDDLQVL